MMKRWISRVSLTLSLTLLFGAVVVAIVNLATAPPVIAQTQSCRAAIVLDRSGSISDSGRTTMINQVMALFDPNTGLVSPTRNYNLAFWTFSYVPNPTSNYNVPFHDFIDTKTGDTNSFHNSLNSIKLGGGTDYQQGFGYNGSVQNNYDGMGNIINNASVIVLLTDGVPDEPGDSDNNAQARNAGRDAAQRLESQGKVIIGGLVGNVDPGSLNYVITGNDKDGRDTFSINANYTDLAVKLKSEIGTTCDQILNTSKTYSLTPSVTTDDRVATGAQVTDIHYNIYNNSKTDTSNLVNWTVQKMVVKKGQSVVPLSFGTDPYRDGYNCDQLGALVNNNTTCDQVASGSGTYGPGDTSLDAAVGPALTSLTIDNTWPIGTKVCFVLTVDQPTQSAAIRNRYSKAACIALGKRPSVQVWGGDLKVGRHFITDNNVAAVQDPARVATSLITGTDGKTYGSWAEYGIFSPGPVVGFASMAGLEGGYGPNLPNTQEFWSKLTFANTDNEYGLFTGNDIGNGTIPDAKTALIGSSKVVQNLNAVTSFDFSNPGITSGTYQKDNGNLSINGGTLAKGNTVIINVPDGTASITGDINYDDGPYTDISQIPRLIIIAKNIVIQSSVGHVSAWLISDDPSGGTIATCEVPGALTIQVCNKQLQIDGPVMARHLSLRRTGGAGPGADANTPAEIINLPADAYLWSQSAGGSSARIQAASTVELPPYF